jgi:hypothetical protein
MPTHVAVEITKLVRNRRKPDCTFNVVPLSEGTDMAHAKSPLSLRTLITMLQERSAISGY